MTQLTYYYSRKFRKKVLIFSIFWYIIGLIILILENDKRIWDYGFVAISLIYLCYFFVVSKVPYIRIKDDKIKSGLIFKNVLNLNTIKEIKSSDNEIILYSKNNDFEINKKLLNTSDTLELKALLYSYIQN